MWDTSNGTTQGITVRKNSLIEFKKQKLFFWYQVKFLHSAQGAVLVEENIIIFKRNKANESKDSSNSYYSS